MDDKTRQDFIEIFAEGFQGLVVPEINQLRKEMKQGFSSMNKRLETVEIRLDIVDRKLDRVVDENIVMKNKVEDHDKQIKKLATRRSISA